MKPMPDDFQIWGPLESFDQLRKRYKVGTPTLRAWSDLIGREDRPGGIKRVPRPDDFAETAATLPQRALSEHYGVSRDIIQRWERECGVKRPRVAGPGRPKRKAFKPAGPVLPLDTVRRDYSVAGQAADFLRRFGPVKRCDAARSYDENGDHWLRGGFLLTAEDVVARATRLGFRVAL